MMGQMGTQGMKGEGMKGMTMEGMAMAMEGMNMAMEGMGMMGEMNDHCMNYTKSNCDQYPMCTWSSGSNMCVMKRM